MQLFRSKKLGIQILLGISAVTAAHADSQGSCTQPQAGVPNPISNIVDIPGRVVGEYRNEIGNCSLKTKQLPNGAEVQIVKMRDGKTYFIPSLSAQNSQHTVVQHTVDQSRSDTNPNSLYKSSIVRYGELSFDLKPTTEDQTSLKALQDQDPQIKSVLQSGLVQVVANRPHRDFSNGGPRKTIWPIQSGKVLIRLERNLANLVFTQGLQVLMPQLDLSKLCGDEANIAIQGNATLPKKSLKTWAHVRFPYGADVFAKFWALRKKQLELSSDDLAGRMKAQDEAFDLLLAHPYPALKQLIQDYGLSPNRLRELVLKEARKQGPFVPLDSNDPVAYMLYQSDEAQNLLRAKVERLHNDGFNITGNLPANARVTDAMLAQQDRLEAQSKAAFERVLAIKDKTWELLSGNQPNSVEGFIVKVYYGSSKQPHASFQTKNPEMPAQ